MFEAKEVKQNTVSAKGQLRESFQLQIYDIENASLRILFVGNSITYHEPNAKIGWNASWGMAASCRENDYVHQAVQMLQKKHETVGFGIAQVANWEQVFDVVTPEEWKKPYIGVSEFQADVVVIRLGENIPSNKVDLPNIKQYIEEMIEFFSVNARQVVVTDNFCKREKLDNILSEVCEEKGYTFCRISDLYEDKSTMALGQFEHEGVALHPSDYGMEMIAKRIVSCVEEF